MNFFMVRLVNLSLYSRVYWIWLHTHTAVFCHGGGGGGGIATVWNNGHTHTAPYFHHDRRLGSEDWESGVLGVTPWVCFNFWGSRRGRLLSLLRFHPVVFHPLPCWVYWMKCLSWRVSHWNIELVHDMSLTEMVSWIKTYKCSGLLK